jgi:[ribosomal protein S18]-alanine N-acetyltransferase
LKELKKEYSIYYYSDNYIDNAIKIFNNKFLYGKTSKYAIPFYIRETSAERKMDQCEKTSSEISTERINATNISQQANLNHKNSEETPKLQEEHINYEILFANASNLNEIFDIENSCFDAPWSIRLIKEEIEVLNGQTILLKNKKSGEIIGYACYRIVDNDSELMRIAIKKNFRDKGLGHLLLDEVIRLVKIKGAKKLNLEVASINAPAIKLYEKHLFKKEGVRKNYYGLGIDGLLFSRFLDKE